MQKSRIEEDDVTEEEMAEAIVVGYGTAAAVAVGQARLIISRSRTSDTGRVGFRHAVTVPAGTPRSSIC